MLVQGRCQTFQNKGAQEQGADRDSKWQFSIDPRTKCHFIWGSRGTGLWIVGSSPPPPFHHPHPNTLCLSSSTHFLIKAIFLNVLQIILAIIITWLFCWMLTAAGVFPDEPSNPAYSGRTDSSNDGIRKTPWFQAPYPGMLRLCSFYSITSNCDLLSASR